MQPNQVSRRDMLGLMATGPAALGVLSTMAATASEPGPNARPKRPEDTHADRRRHGSG